MDETLRTLAGRVGVLGAMGVYRAAFTSMEQTQPLTDAKVKVPVVALAGDHGLGSRVRQGVELVSERVSGETIVDCGHFLPEENPEVVLRHALAITGDRGRHRADQTGDRL